MEVRRLSTRGGLGLLCATLSVALALPASAAPSDVRPKASEPRKIASPSQIRPKPAVGTTKPVVAPPANRLVQADVTQDLPPKRAAEASASEEAFAKTPQIPPSAQVGTTTTPTPTASVPNALAAAGPTTVSNPYLPEGYRPVPAAALPAMAVGQINYNARYVSAAVNAIPTRLADSLPSIKTVYPTGGRELVVANIKCPAEMITGQYLIPANAMREGINGLFHKLNESQLLKFDIQLVCS